MDFWTLPTVIAPYLWGDKVRGHMVPGSHSQQGAPGSALVRFCAYLCRRSLSDVNSRYSDTLRPVMSTRTSPVTTFMLGGRPPTPLGQEKPAPCMEQVHRTGSWMERGRGGGEVTGSEETTCEWSSAAPRACGGPAQTYRGPQLGPPR